MLSIETTFRGCPGRGYRVGAASWEKETEVVVLEGRVRFENGAGGLVVTSQEAAVARQGPYWYSIAVGGGAVHVYNASTNAYLYTCRCSTTRGSGPSLEDYPAR